MQLQKWTLVNKRYFAPRAGLSQLEWQALIRNGVVNGRIIGPYTFVDIDQLAASIELTGKPDTDMPNLLE